MQKFGKPHLANIERIRVAESRNLMSGLRLDRNERVANWENDVILNALNGAQDWLLSVYPDSRNIYEKIAKFDGVSVDQILITSGIDGGIKTILEVICEPGDVIGIVDPTYAMYGIYGQIFSLEVFRLEYTKERQFNWSAFEQFLSTKPKAFFLPNPNQPIEDNFSLDLLREVAKRLDQIGCLFLIDEAYYLFGSDTALPLAAEFNNVIIARTFSKGFGLPSIRLGYLISNISLIKVLTSTRFAHESNALTNLVAEYLLDNFSLVSEYNQKVVDSRKLIIEYLKRLGINSYGEWGNFLLIDFNTKANAEAVVKKLHAHEIYVKGPWRTPFDSCITITVGPFELMEPFLEILKSQFEERNNP